MSKETQLVEKLEKELKQTGLSQDEKDELQRQLFFARKVARQQKKEQIEYWKPKLELAFLGLFFYGIAYYYLRGFTVSLYKNLRFLTDINYATGQMSTLIDNIRTYYTIHPNEGIGTDEQLIKLGIVPEPLIDDDGETLINPFGGKIIVRPSRPLENIKEAVESQTFKISYQGLSNRVCVALAVMEWGNKDNGLLSTAIGNFDEETGIDNALVDVDRVVEQPKPVTVKDKRGRMRTIRPRMHYLLNVSKPGDSFLPTPFTLSNAKAGCTCGFFPTCSFALRYTIFGVDKPIRGTNEVDDEEDIEDLEDLETNKTDKKVSPTKEEQQKSAELRKSELTKKWQEKMKEKPKK